MKDEEKRSGKLNEQVMLEAEIEKLVVALKLQNKVLGKKFGNKSTRNTEIRKSSNNL